MIPLIVLIPVLALVLSLVFWNELPQNSYKWCVRAEYSQFYLLTPWFGLELSAGGPAWDRLELWHGWRFCYKPDWSRMGTGQEIFTRKYERVFAVEKLRRIR